MTPTASGGAPYVVVVHGIDIVDVHDFGQMLKTGMKAHLTMTFTAQELEECGDNVRSAERLAGRFATKEATLKALGLPYGDGVGFLDIETVVAVNGAPTVVTHRRVSERAALLGVETWLVSTSHTSKLAAASVIGVRLLPEG